MGHLIGQAPTDPSVPLFWASLTLLFAYFLLLKSSGRIPRLMVQKKEARPAQVEVDTASWVPTLEASDRRRSHRRGGDPTPVLLVGLDGNQRLSGRVLDRSRTGLRLEAPRPAAAGTVLLVRACPAPADSLWVPMTV